VYILYLFSSGPRGVSSIRTRFCLSRSNPGAWKKRKRRFPQLDQVPPRVPSSSGHR